MIQIRDLHCLLGLVLFCALAQLYINHKKNLFSRQGRRVCTFIKSLTTFVFTTHLLDWTGWAGGSNTVKKRTKYGFRPRHQETTKPSSWMDSCRTWHIFRRSSRKCLKALKEFYRATSKVEDQQQILRSHPTHNSDVSLHCTTGS